MRMQSLLLALVALCQPLHAADGLSQTTISVLAGGKAVAGFTFPIGSKIASKLVANRMEERDKTIRLTGNVQGRFTPPAGQEVVFYGEEIVISSEAISPERAQAVKDLEAMASSDQLYRGRSTTGDLTPDEWAKQNAIDDANMKRLAQIIDAYGWPGLRFAGAASHSSFLVLQHADPESQRKYLPLLRQAVARNDALGSSLALLEDRVRIREGKPQLYGSQLIGRPLQFAPIEDEPHVDQRRRSVGLESLADYAKRFGITYTPPATKQ